MAKMHTPTVKEITKKLKQMGYQKVNGKASDVQDPYGPKRKMKASRLLQVKETSPSYRPRKRKLRR